MFVMHLERSYRINTIEDADILLYRLYQLTYLVRAYPPIIGGEFREHFTRSE